MTTLTIRDLGLDDPAWDAAFPVLVELRTHLDRATFDELHRRGQQQGLVFTAAFATDGRCVGVAGWRVIHKTSTIRELYVDDLVVSSAHRSTGVGAAMLAHLEERGREAGCLRIELDSGRQRVDAHRFYHREGYTDAALHFTKDLAAPG